MIKNILVEIAFDGSNFSGFQIQKSYRSVEKELLDALIKVTDDKEIRIISCGRTDAGVHAKSLYFNFLTNSKIRPDTFKYHINPYLPDDIIALDSREVDLNFHARFNCRAKTYKYIISRQKDMHPIYRNYKENITYSLDLGLLQEGLDILKGEHDFRLFMYQDPDIKINTVRKIDDAYFKIREDDLEIYFKAESFLHNQVRIMTGSLIELARGKITLKEFLKFFDKDYNKRANPSLKAGGLYLWRIEY